MTNNNRNDELNTDSEFGEEPLPDDIVAMLADVRVWDVVPDATQEAIVASIMAETAAGPQRADTPSKPASIVAPIKSARPWRSVALGAAAALVVVLGLLGISRIASRTSPDYEVALSATDLVPGASAVVEITEMPQGTRFILKDVALDPAAPGTYYEAWLRKDAAVGVSAGTFHLRSGDGVIELWAGVSVEDYPLLTITLQQEAQAESSGQVVLRVCHRRRVTV